MMKTQWKLFDLDADKTNFWEFKGYKSEVDKSIWLDIELSWGSIEKNILINLVKILPNLFL